MTRFFIPGRRIQTGESGADATRSGGRSVTAGTSHDRTEKMLDIDAITPTTVSPSLAVPTADDYLTRLIKYIPTENVGFYLFVRGVIPRGNGGGPWIAFLISLALVPIYMSIAARSEHKPALISQAAFATVAFVVWVFAIGGPFETMHWYQHSSWIPAVMLAMVTLLIGAWKPSPGS